MRKKIGLLVVSCLMVLLLLSGCGVPQEEYDAVVAERDAAEAQVASLQSDLAEVENDLATAQSHLTTAQSHLATVESDLTAVQNDLAAAERDVAAVEAQIAELEAEKTELEAQVAELEARIAELEKEALNIGDWTVSEELTVEDVIIILNGNLVVKPEASLTLKNVKLRVNCSYDGEYGILVEPGGSIFIYDSNITSPNPLQRWHAQGLWYEPTGVSEQESPRFTFVVKHAAAFVMKNSQLHGCGWGEVWYGDSMSESVGLVLNNADDAIIEGNIFSNNGDSLSIRDTSNILIQNNVFLCNDVVTIFLMRVSDSTISDNIFSSSLHPITAVESKGNTIINNTFSNFYEAAVWLMSECEDNIVADNDISALPTMAWAGIAIGSLSTHVANNNVIRGNTISDCKHGVAIYFSSNNRIENNSIAESCHGVFLGYASQNIIISNNISHMGGGFACGGGDGVQVYHSWDNVIANNCISTVDTYGILFYGSSWGNTLQGNDIQSCLRGIGVYQSSDDNKIINNAISLSERSGIMLNNSEDNIIYSNNFIDNGEPAYDDAENHWYWEGRGNYWSDYDGEDDDNDGVGDIPQHITLNGIDSCPMVEPLTITSLPVPEQETVPTPAWLPPAEPITGEVVWQDKTITLNSYQLVVEKGGSLTLDNVTLVMARGVDGIYVHPGGSLYIYNSRIIPAEGGGGFLFQVQKDAVLVMKDSELYGCGFTHGGDWGGLQIVTTTATIENNLITDCHFGVILRVSVEDTSIYIRNNIISDCYRAILGPEFVEGHIENNTFLNCIK